MRKHIRKYLLPFLLGLVGLQAGSFDKVGTTTAQFLKLGAGARAIGMGGAFVALADDGSAAFWNPAGLTQASGFRTQFDHQDWLVDISHEYFSLQVPLNASTVAGVSLTALTMADKEIRTVSEPDGTGQFYSVMDLALTGSLARQISDRLSYGISLKYIQSTAYSETARTMALDIGSILRTDFQGLRIGIALSNFGGELRYSGIDLIGKADIDDQFDGNVLSDSDLRTESWPLPVLIRIGFALDLLGPGPALITANTQRLTLAVDGEHPNDNPEHLNLGIEYAFTDLVYLRAGYRFNYDLDGLTLGAGVRLPIRPLGGLSVNYAVRPMGLLGTASTVSLEIQF